MSLPQTPSGSAPRLRRGALAVTAVALSLTALTACGAGNNAQTLGIKPDTAEATVDTISVQNANVITQPKASTEGPAVISATIFNAGRKAQTIDAISLTGDAGSVKLTPAEGTGPITVPAEGSVVIGGKGNASAVVENGLALTKNIGGVQKTVFRFSETGEVKLNAFVVPATEYFKGFGPSSLPKPPAAPSGSPSGEPSESASGQPGTEGEQGTEQGTEGEPGDGTSSEPGTPASESADSTG
ncbi:DUF461 domain-containing protein [Streptomyces sp. NPDC020965]|uniref:DUF461 domain-containing protein n=1 Tax=Streptomyces sp. NPDC020965 TaxID=3365105 RepID=UPI00378F5B38